jgi:hypothetical protein
VRGGAIRDSLWYGAVAKLSYNAKSRHREVDFIMAGIVWLYLTTIVVIAVIAVLVVSTLRRGRLGINLRSVHCPSCVTPMSVRRRPVFGSQLLFRGWMCPHCGAKLDKWGRNVSETA